MFKWSQADCIAIPLLLVGVVGISILLHFLLKGKSEKIRQIPLHIISLLLIALEIAKQIYFAATGQYTKNTIPAHFCSLIVVIIALCQFLPRKVAKWLDAPSVVFSFTTILLLLVHPYSLIGSASELMFASFPSFHAFYFHALVIAYPVAKLSLIDMELKPKYSLSIIGCILFYMAYAIPMAFTLNSNYLNILHNAFPPLESFRLQCGQVWYEIVWVLTCIAICLAIYFAWYGIYILIKKRRKKNA